MEIIKVNFFFYFTLSFSSTLYKLSQLPLCVSGRLLKQHISHEKHGVMVYFSSECVSNCFYVVNTEVSETNK